MQKDITNEKVNDSEIFVDLIYNEQFERAIEWLNDKILPVVEQSLGFLQVKLVSNEAKFEPPKFSIEKENHLIKDEDNLIKIQSGKYFWRKFVPKGKFVKVTKKESWVHSYNELSIFMPELKKKLFYRDELVQWIFDDFCRKSEFGMDIFGIDTLKSISIVKNDKITIYLTDYIQRIKEIEKVKHSLPNKPINWMISEFRKVTGIDKRDIRDILLEKKNKQNFYEWDLIDVLIEIALERGIDLTNLYPIGVGVPTFPMYYSEAEIISNFRSKVEKYLFELGNMKYKNKNGNLMWKFFYWLWRNERTALQDYIQLTEKMGYHLFYKEKTGNSHRHHGEITLTYIRWLYRNKSKELMDFMNRICPVF